MTAYILNLADLAFTLYALGKGGVELNPLMQDIPTMIQHKVATIGFLCCMLELIARGIVTDNPITQKVAMWGLRLCTTVYALICIHHLYFILGGILLWINLQ